MTVKAEISPSPLSLPAESEVALPSDGAVVVFAGVVRDSSDSVEVTALEYESYEAMALARMTEIGEEAAARWRLGAVLLRHRTGRLEVGETSVIVAASAPHRREAFEACMFCIDSLKTSAAIWKKEIFADGTSRWAEGA